MLKVGFSSDWHGDEFQKKILDEERRRMERATRYVKNQVVQSLGIKSPPASAPGEPPGLRTGELRRSINSEVEVESSKIVGRVGTNKQYAVWLLTGTTKMAARDFLVGNLHRCQGMINSILTAPIR